MQSNLQCHIDRRLHVSIIMDGNGRWAKLRHLPRQAGHIAGVEAVRRAVEAAPKLGIATLTLYAFSSDNWRRPKAEVTALMQLLKRYLDAETQRLVETGTRLTVIGRRDRLPDFVVAVIERAETATRHGSALNLRIALDYSARAAILQAAARLGGQKDVTQEAFSRLLNEAPNCRNVDLLIRTSGEQRLSDFLLWECAYAELYFTERFWPEFSADDLKHAVETFAQRDRRFGALPEEKTMGAGRVLSAIAAKPETLTANQ